MTHPTSSRLCLAAALVAALAIGSMVAAERSSSAMATAATRFVNALTPDQRRQASFAFDSDERLHWHFIPTETFPREGPKKGLRILGPEEDAARALLQSLDASQRTKAILDAKAPNDMLTVAKVDISPLSPTGLAAEAMTAAQRDLLMKLIDVYTGYMAPDIAADREARLRKAGVEKIGFAWAGETERGKKHYYRIQGPTFLVEYDNTQNDGNHIHSVWRDFDGDFGRDLLREHLRTVAH